MNFYPRSPCGERPRYSGLFDSFDVISIHALLAESDICAFWTVLNRPLFLSTLSLRRATAQSMYHNTKFWFLSTLSLRRATPVAASTSDVSERISIHALLAESDYILVNTFLAIFEFLSTLSLRRATSIGSVINNIINDFYPRSPCGERLLQF